MDQTQGLQSDIMSFTRPTDVTEKSRQAFGYADLSDHLSCFPPTISANLITHYFYKRTSLQELRHLHTSFNSQDTPL